MRYTTSRKRRTTTPLAKLARGINILRRKTLHSATQALDSRLLDHYKSLDIPVRNVLVCRPNHRLGNLLLLSPLLAELEVTFPDAKVDILCKGGLGSVLFERFTNVRKIFSLPRKPFVQPWRYLSLTKTALNKYYDLVINAVPDSSSGRLFTKKANAIHKISGIPPDSAEKIPDDHLHMAKGPVYALRAKAQTNPVSSIAIDAPIPPLSLRLSAQERENGRAVLTRLVGHRQKTICLFTHASGPKRYSKAWWGELYTYLKQAFPECYFLEVLPVENTSQIDFTATTFYSTDIRELAAVIGNCDAFIGADSGITHLASAAHTATVGLFFHHTTGALCAL